MATPQSNVQTPLASVAFGDTLNTSSGPNLIEQQQQQQALLAAIAAQQNLLEDEGGQPLPFDPTAIFAAANAIGQNPQDQFASIDELITARTDPALGLLQQGSDEQLRLARLGTQAGIAPLQQADDLRAFEEQQSILGFRGREAQEQAIGGIPVSQFNQELQKRQRQQLTRGAAARGEAGGGATIAAGSQLAGAQQADIIQQRLAQLEPLAALSRGVRGTISSLQEQGRVGEAQIQSGLGTQQANIRLGATAPQIQGRLNQAELSGLQGIASADLKAQQQNQLAGLAGTLAGSFGGG